MSDLISRRAAIKAIDDLPNCYNGYSDTYDKAYIIGVLEELPSIDVPDTNVGDLISKSAVLDNAWEVMYKDEWYMTQTEQVVSVNDIEALPTIEPKRGKWIPCKKRMPKPNETVNWVQKHYLVQNEFGDMMVASYRGSASEKCLREQMYWWEQMYHFKPIEDEIVAWMELPEEYKDCGEDEHTD